MNYYQFASSDEDAAERFARAKVNDPFPEVPAALLNSTQIKSYVEKTGMIYPFHTKSDKTGDKFKTASYEVDLLGQFKMWNKDGKLETGEIVQGQSFRLPKNSIAFVQVEPYFRIPLYIALRFNLKIRHVYRGLLLGTGPLVDPGFEGNLYIPLHNLTSNDYDFVGGEGLIWMEFTKVAFEESVLEHLSKFPERKLNFKLDDYLVKASPHKPIRSSIPLEVAEAQKKAADADFAASKSLEEATRARNEAEKVAEEANAFVRRVQYFSTAATVAIVIGIATIVLMICDLVGSQRRELQEKLQKVEEQILQLDVDSMRGSDTISQKELSYEPARNQGELRLRRNFGLGVGSYDSF